MPDGRTMLMQFRGCLQLLSSTRHLPTNAGGRLMRGNRCQKVNSSSYQVHGVANYDYTLCNLSDMQRTEQRVDLCSLHWSA